MPPKMFLVKAEYHNAEYDTVWNLYLFTTEELAKQYADELRKIISDYRHNKNRKGYWIDKDRLAQLDPNGIFYMQGHQQDGPIFNDSDLIESTIYVETLCIMA